MNAILPQRVQKQRKRETRWRSQAHTTHVRLFACCNCGSTTNVIAAHVKMGAHTGMGQKGDDWLTAPLCDGPFSNVQGQLGCHQVQHSMGEPSFWAKYAEKKGHTVWDLLAELQRTSPRRSEIERVKRERENG